MLLVTGITGHSGQYFLKELIENDYNGTIRCIVRSSSDTTLLDNSGLDIEKVVGDINNQEFINNVMQDVHTVLHIYNIHHSPAIYKAAIKNNVDRTILIHTTGIYSKFKNASAEYELIENEVIRLSSQNNSPDLTILRPTMIYGDLCDSNISKFITLIDKLPIVPIINKGKSLLQPVNARDLGKSYYSVLMSPQKTKGNFYNLSGEKPIELRTVFKLISKELNQKKIYINIPLQFGVILTSIIKAITKGKVDYVEKVQRMGENRSYSHLKASKDFNYQPMSLAKGIELEVGEYLEWKNKK
ncbi:NAD(P)H-binding protein [Halobacillus litoralis]|uniref:NAD-dependent epimerase/dehydratase family protein n=1 Tax=Halobacillus litoralis TaxID=45668 RepID=UPI001CFDF6EB|nr:NAD(P)H-binding protein [Halobacillus litoralis]WLR49047.1 NAD(P)H-binding protein [Halobacillus litoralis]